MQNNFTIKNNNIFFSKLKVINLIALAILSIYFFSITLLPIIDGIINTRQNNLFIIAQNKNINLQQQILKSKTNGANTIATATYINNGQILARQIDNNNLQNYINDGKGLVLKLNNSDGSNVQNYSYDAYGNILKSPNSLPLTRDNNFLLSHDNKTPSLQAAQQQSNPKAALLLVRDNDINIPNLLQYNGERSDNNTKLQYLRARFYNPEIKRFINQDNYNLLNKFNYVNENPVMRTDPGGHDNFNPFSAQWWENTFKSGAIGIIERFGIVFAGLATAGLIISGTINYLRIRKLNQFESGKYANMNNINKWKLPIIDMLFNKNCVACAFSFLEGIKSFTGSVGEKNQFSLAPKTIKRQSPAENGLEAVTDFSKQLVKIDAGYLSQTVFFNLANSERSNFFAMGQIAIFNKHMFVVRINKDRSMTKFDPQKGTITENWRPSTRATYDIYVLAKRSKNNDSQNGTNNTKRSENDDDQSDTGSEGYQFPNYTIEVRRN